MTTLSYQKMVFWVLSSFALWAVACSRAPEGASADTDTPVDDTNPDEDADGRPRYTAADQDATVFHPDMILEYHVTISASDMNRLEEYGYEEIFMPVTLRVVGPNIDVTIEDAGYRYKGAYSLHSCWDSDSVRLRDAHCGRISKRFKFDKFNKPARLFGLKRLNLHAMNHDSSRMREHLAYALFNEFGVDAPRTAYAKLYVNGEYDGLYTAVEAIDGRYTAFHYPDGKNGNLYKEIWPRQNMDERWVLTGLVTNDDPEDEPDVSGFVAFGNAIAATTEATFLADMVDWVHIEQLLRYIAVDRAIRNWDGIMAFYSPITPHNFFWYHDDSENPMFHLIPWDMDLTFGEFDIYMHPRDWCTAEPIPDWNVTPLNCIPRPGCRHDAEISLTPPACDPLIGMLAATSWDRFVGIGAELLSELFTYESMNARLTQWEDQIRDLMEEDPWLRSTDWQEATERLRSILREAIHGFADHLQEGLRTERQHHPREESTLNDPIVESGWNPDQVNNFEFPGVALDWTGYTGSSASTGSVTAVLWNSEDPISGMTDLRFTVDFARLNAPWAEWATVAFHSDGGEYDITEFDSLWVTLSSDTTRAVRLSFGSPVYGESFGGVWQVFSFSVTVTDSPAQYRIPLDRVTYPQWAKDNWTGTQGWTLSDNAARNEVFSRVNRLDFTVHPNSSDQGIMLTETERVTLHVDNLYFD